MLLFKTITTYVKLLRLVKTLLMISETSGFIENADIILEVGGIVGTSYASAVSAAMFVFHSFMFTKFGCTKLMNSLVHKVELVHTSH